VLDFEVESAWWHALLESWKYRNMDAGRNRAVRMELVIGDEGCGKL